MWLQFSLPRRGPLPVSPPLPLPMHINPLTQFLKKSLGPLLFFPTPFPLEQPHLLTNVHSELTQYFSPSFSPPYATRSLPHPTTLVYSLKTLCTLCTEVPSSRYDEVPLRTLKTVQDPQTAHQRLPALTASIAFFPSLPSGRTASFSARYFFFMFRFFVQPPRPPST